MPNALTLLDIHGPIKVYAMHPSQPIVCYAAGQMLILWNAMYETKRCLVEHRSDIIHIYYFSNYLLTVDDANPPTFCLWDSTYTLLQHTALSLSHQGNVQNCLTTYDANTKTLFMVINEKQGYFLSCWRLEKGLLLIFQLCMDTMECCNSLFAFDHRICTIEKNAIKLWTYNNTAKLNNTFLNDKNIVAGELYEGNLALLTDDGLIILCTLQGKYISCLNIQNYKFTSMTTDDNIIYLGTSLGEVYGYVLSTLSMVCKIAYPSNKAKKFTNTNLVIAPSVIKIIIASNPIIR